MNSIQKEREAFEKAFAQTEFYRNKADLYSLLADIDDETFDFFRKNGFGDYSIGEAQAAWSAWQAAKAQAVPGQICVTRERLQELIEIGVKAALEERGKAMTAKILDPCCGSRMMHFDRQNPNVVFVSKWRMSP